MNYDWKRQVIRIVHGGFVTIQFSGQIFLISPIEAITLTMREDGICEVAGRTVGMVGMRLVRLVAVLAKHILRLLHIQ